MGADSGEWLYSVEDTMTGEDAPEAIFSELPKAEQHRDELNSETVLAGEETV